MPTDTAPEELRRRRDDLRRQLAEIGDFRPGSLRAFFRQMRQAGMSLRGRGRPGPRSRLGHLPPCRRQDGEPGHSRRRGRGDAGAGRRASALPSAREGSDRGQRGALPGASGSAHRDRKKPLRAVIGAACARQAVAGIGTLAGRDAAHDARPSQPPRPPSTVPTTIPARFAPLFVQELDRPLQGQRLLRHVPAAARRSAAGGRRRGRSGRS